MSYSNKSNSIRPNLSNQTHIPNKNDSLRNLSNNQQIQRRASQNNKNINKQNDNKHSYSSVEKPKVNNNNYTSSNNYSLYPFKNNEISNNIKGVYNNVNCNREDIKINYNGLNSNFINKTPGSNYHGKQEIKIKNISEFPSHEEYLNKQKSNLQNNGSIKTFSANNNNDRNLIQHQNNETYSLFNKSYKNPSNQINYHQNISNNNNINSQNKINIMNNNSVNHLINGITEQNKNNNYDFLKENLINNNKNSKNNSNSLYNYSNNWQKSEKDLNIDIDKNVISTNEIKINNQSNNTIKESSYILKNQNDFKNESSLYMNSNQNKLVNSNMNDLQNMSNSKAYQKNSSFSILQNNTQIPQKEIKNIYEENNISKFSKNQSTNFNLNNYNNTIRESNNPINNLNIYNNNKEIYPNNINKVPNILDDKDKEIDIKNETEILNFFKISKNVNYDNNIQLTDEEIFNSATSKSIYINQDETGSFNNDLNLKSVNDFYRMKSEIDYKINNIKQTQENIYFEHKNFEKNNSLIDYLNDNGKCVETYNINSINNYDDKYRINSKCYNDVKEILEEKGSNKEIKNNKIFSSASISKSFSSNVEDYVKIKETKIDRSSLNEFYDSLEKFYTNEFEFFFMELEKCGFYNKELQFNKVGPISSLEHYIKTKFHRNLETKTPIMEIDLLENNIFRWRNICGDGNCFYRAVMFSYIENILIEDKDYEFINLIRDIHEFTKIPELKRLFDFNNINYNYLIKSLFYIIFIRNRRIKNYKLSKYEVFIILLNNNRDIDLGLILYLRIKIFKFIEENKTKIYSKEFNVKMGNLLSENYEEDGENFLWNKFYDENLLKLYTEAENIIIYVTPFILQINLKIFTYDIGNEHSNKFRYISCQLENKHTAFVFYRKIHYDLIYSKEHFEKIQNNFVNYVDCSDSDVNIEFLKKQAEKAKYQINLKNEKENNESEEQDKTMEIDNQVIENPNLINFIEGNINNKNPNNENNKQNDNNDIVDINKIEIGVNNKKAEKKEFDDTSFNLLGTIDIEENVGNNKNEIFKQKTNKSICQMNLGTQSDNKINNSLYSNVIQKNNLNNIYMKFNDINNKEDSIENKLYHSSIKNSEIPNINNDKKSILENGSQIKNNNIINSKLYQFENRNLNSNQDINENIIIKQDSNLISSRQEKIALNPTITTNSYSCSLCNNIIDDKITRIIGKNICLNCLNKEIKSVLLTKIYKSINNSLNLLFNEKKFAPFSLKIDEKKDIAIFDKKFPFKFYKDDLNINFENLIENIIQENCLVCLSQSPVPCKTKNNIKFPCNLCSFNSTEHFQYFLKCLIEVNISIKTKAFTCLCNQMFSLKDIFEIFNLIKLYKLDDEFFAMKNYLIDIHFKRFCFSCKINLDNFEKLKIFVKDQFMTSFVYLTEFEHIICYSCYKTMNFKGKLKSGIKIKCELCQLEHTPMNEN